MIKNEREYKITRSQADKFEQALDSLRVAPEAEGVDPKLREIEAAALRSQLEDLRHELSEYESLKAGERDSLPVETLDQLPQALIQARIACDMNQEELADLLGLSKQMIQRYEASNYGSASLSRLKEVASALGVNFSGHASVPTRLPDMKALFARLASSGLDRDFILDRVLPSTLTAELEDAETEPERAHVLRMLENLTNVFGWSIPEVLGSDPLPYGKAALSAGFKLPQNASERRTRGYAVYAHKLASIALKATRHLDKQPICTEPKLVRSILLEQYGAVDFEPALRWVWSLGIPVLPLQDSIAFYGACWREQGRNVIVVKQNQQHAARWLADLLHELYHASVAPELPERTVLDLNPLERRGEDEEDFANDFASDVMLNDRADRLAVMCVSEAESARQRTGSRAGNLPFLKSAVRKVAESESVPADALANYMAFRLSLPPHNQNWWPTAHTFQRSDPNPWEVARNVFFEHARFDALDEAERELLTRALTEVLPA